MKIKENFVMRQLARTWVVMPVATPGAEPVGGYWRLSSTGALLWQTLEKGCREEDLVEALLAAYPVDRDVAAEDVRQFLQKLEQMNCLEP